MRVFIIQDSGDKNFSSLISDDVTITVVTNRDCPLFGNHDDHVLAMRRVLADYKPGDGLVLVGDPVNIGIAVHEILSKKGGVLLLKWDRQTRNYIPIKLGDSNNGGKT